MLCICASAGANFTAREHFAAALALDMPVFCVVTKTDRVAPAALQQTLRATREMLAAAAGTVSGAVSGADVLDSSESGRLHGCSSDGEGGGAAAQPPQSSLGVSVAPTGALNGDAASEGTMFDLDEQQERQLQRHEQVLGFRVYRPFASRCSSCCSCVLSAWLFTCPSSLQPLLPVLQCTTRRIRLEPSRRSAAMCS